MDTIAITVPKKCVTVTLTLSECVENHVGMQKVTTSQAVASQAERGFATEFLLEKKAALEQRGAQCEYYDLTTLLPEEKEVPAAGVLVIRKGIDWFLREKGGSADALLVEQVSLDWDSKAFMYGRVVNKNARHNLCYAQEAQEPDYQNKRGRIIAFRDVPQFDSLRKEINETFAVNLIAEGNLYYDVSKCGIGYHGDGERRLVVGCRLGANLPLHYTWFRESRPLGNTLELQLHHGDIYLMSDKAVGNDWKKRKILTLRHAAGCPKFLKLGK